jgi:predicted metal-binding membrane protein
VGLASFVTTNRAPLEQILERDRVVVVAALGVLVVLSWGYVLWFAANINMGGMDMSGFRIIPALKEIMVPDSTPWSGVEFAFVFVMWAVMMVGMMTPSAAPMILVYAHVARQAAIANKPFAPTGWFAAGYLLVWVSFALVATVAQWALDRAALLDPKMESASNLLGSFLLIVAGAYQWTRIKDVCLANCQSPILFLQQQGGFRRDKAGSLLLGIRHGTYCVGCCWVLMALLFVGGVMNVLWMAALSVLILLEKTVAIGRLIARLAGLGLAAAGVWLLLAGT